jgi:hypothetical protein
MGYSKYRAYYAYHVDSSCDAITTSYSHNILVSHTTLNTETREDVIRRRRRREVTGASGAPRLLGGPIPDR